MRIINNVETKNIVLHLEKVKDETFLAGEYDENIEFINKRDLTCLSHLNLEGVYGIRKIENFH